ncbi:MAG: hypothetical protein Q9P14_16005 [candidate division KSB1 bacterium]|nr:hypothetical protein [candidate division KSB1 bacterium]
MHSRSSPAPGYWPTSTGVGCTWCDRIICTSSANPCPIPALAAATVGIAMGAAGTDVALETADVALMADNLGKLPEVFLMSRKARRIIRQNLGLSVAVISVLMAGALTGTLSLPLAVLGHELSEFAVIGNGLRMVRR